MSDTTKTLYAVLKNYWRLASDRHYRFFVKDNKHWLSTSLDSIIKYTKMSRDSVLAELEALKVDDRIDFYTCDFNNREFVSYSNNW